MTFTPRPWQLEARTAVHRSWAEHPGVGALLDVAPGCGKTAAAAWIASQESGRIVWLADRQKLVHQAHQTASWFPGLDPGIVMGKRDDHGRRVVFASVATLHRPPRLRRLLESGTPDLLVIDEAHHSVSPMWRGVIDGLQPRRVLGLSATPDAPGMSEHWRIAYSLPYVEAVQAGVLLPLYAARYQVPDLDVDPEASGDADVEAALLRAHVVEHTVQAMGAEHHAARLPQRDSLTPLSARGRQGLVYCQRVRQAERTADALREAGWTAEVVSGETPDAEKERICTAFEAGLLDVICNALIYTEGADFPAASFVVLARAFSSHTLYVQAVTRACRTSGRQTEALAIDLVGATERHSVVSAPALILRRAGCTHHADGAHRYVGDALLCECGERHRCEHEYRDGVCAACNEVQCPDGPGQQHHWIPWEDHQIACAWCEAVLPDPMGAFVRRRRADDAPDVEWLDVAPGVAAASWEGVGTLLRRTVAGRLVQLEWDGRRLTREPVEPAMADLLASDVARRAGQAAEAPRWGWQRDRVVADARRWV